MDASRHLMEFYRPLVLDLGVVPAHELGDLRGDQWLMVAGVKVASQTPAVRSGQRIIFLTLDDGTGLAEVTVFERAQPWTAKAVFHGFLLAVWGRLRRTGKHGASVVAEQVWDLAELMAARKEGRLEEAVFESSSIGAGFGIPEEIRPSRRAVGADAQRNAWRALVASRGSVDDYGRPLPPRKLWHASGGSAG